MAHYAILNENNLVTNVFVGEDESTDVDWELHYSEKAGTPVKRTSYNTRGGVHYDAETGEASADQSKAFRGNYAGVGFAYDEALDAFIPPKPSDDAILDEATYSWIVPEPEEA